MRKLNRPEHVVLAQAASLENIRTQIARPTLWYRMLSGNHGNIRGPLERSREGLNGLWPHKFAVQGRPAPAGPL